MSARYDAMAESVVKPAPMTIRCNYCGQSCRHITDLLRHCQQAHMAVPGRVWECSRCLHTGGQPWSICPQCGSNMGIRCSTPGDEVGSGPPVSANALTICRRMAVVYTQEG